MRVVFIPHALARPAEELGRLEGGVWAAIEDAALIAALDEGAALPLLHLSVEDHRAATAGLSGKDLAEAVRRRIHQAERWPDMALGVAYAGERRALHALLASPLALDAGLDATETRALVEGKLGTLADLVGFRQLAIQPLAALCPLVLERSWALVAEIADAEQEASREGVLGAISRSTGAALAEARARAEELGRLDAARRGVAAGPSPVHVPIRRGVHFASAGPELVAALRRRFLPFVPLGGGCVAACSTTQLDDLRQLDASARVVIASGAALAEDATRLGGAELAAKLGALAADRRPAALGLLRHALDLGLDARAAELVLGRVAARVDAPDPSALPPLPVLAALAALAEAGPQTDPALRLHALLAAALRDLGEAAPAADLVAAERASLADLRLLGRLTAARADLAETTALLAELHARKRAELARLAPTAA